MRDKLMGVEADEIDIATSAPPQVIQKLFPKTIPVGIAFGVVIVAFEGVHFEVTTFRKDHSYADGRHPEGVDFSTPEKDAQRRDFTINGLFYDPLTETLYDYVEGERDIERKLIRAIGDPHARFQEDRLRMLRAVRFSTRFDFALERETEKAIAEHASKLFPSVSWERVWQELSKMAQAPRFGQALLMLQELGLLATLFPALQSKEITALVKPFPYFPLKTPAIIYLLELFDTLEERLELCERLKVSRRDLKLAHFFSEPLPTKDHDWAHFYAHPDSRLRIQVEGAKILPPERAPYLEEHMEREKRLAPHIERITRGKPLVTSSHLKERGVAPGKQMGELLKIAETIAIDQDLHVAEEVLAKLNL